MALAARAGPAPSASEKGQTMRPHGTRDRAPIPSEPDPARGSPALGGGGV